MVEHVRFYQFFLFPLVVASRFVGRRWKQQRDLEDRPGPLLNRLFGLVNGFEVRLTLAGARFPIGSSLVLIASKELP